MEQISTNERQTEQPAAILPLGTGLLRIPRRRWSMQYDRCDACGTTERAHEARGLCKRCYDRWYNAERQAA